MLVSNQTTRILLQAVERYGIDPAEVVGPPGLALAPLVEPGGSVAWVTVTRLCQRVWELVGEDPTQMQQVGRHMISVPSFEAIRWIAKTVASVKTFYYVAERWIAPANFPHLRIFLKSSDGRRIAFHGVIPERYAPSAPFFHITIGLLAEMPVLMGLPPARIVDARVGPRAFDLDLDLPEHTSVVARAMRRVTTTLKRSQSRHVLEEQRRHLARGFETAERTRDELQAILEHLPDLVFIHEGGRIVFANRALVKVLGWPSWRDLVGAPVHVLVDAGSLAAVGAPPVARGDGAPRSVDDFERAHFVSSDGSRVVVELAPVRQVVFAGVASQLVVGRDVRDREKLHQRLAAADRLASVGVLAAGVAHEINNPLSYVLNNIELAKNQLGAASEAAQPREALDIALEGVTRIRVIVRELLQLARGDEGMLGPTDAKSVVESTLALARVEISTVATLVPRFSPVPPVHASPARIAQIVLNLVLNAVEAMRGRPKEENELVVAIGTSADGRVFLEVSDNGEGVAPEVLPRVFEPFYATKDLGRGTSLGLAITQRLVLELDGEIGASSSPRGTTFRVVLNSEDSAPRRVLVTR